METLDLAGGGGREGCAQEGLDPVVATCPVEEPFAGRQSEAVGGDLAVVGELFLGRAILLEGRREVPADLATNGSGHDSRADHETRVVVNAGQDLALGAVF